MMSYEDFLTQIKQNTSKNELYEYKDLCRFCLQNICVENQQRYGIDISDNICSLKQQRNDILNNYSIITKRYVSKGNKQKKKKNNRQRISSHHRRGEDVKFSFVFAFTVANIYGISELCVCDVCGAAQSLCTFHSTN